MADGSNILTLPTARQVAKVASLRPAPVIEHPQANAFGFPPVQDAPRRRFHPADPGAVRLGVVRLGPEVVDELLRLFEREAGRTGDWSLFDDLSAAESGLTPEPPPEAA